MPSPAGNAGFPLPTRVVSRTKNVWAEYAQLDRDHRPLNLGQGSPDYLVTRDFNNVLAEVAANADNEMTQYARAFVSTLDCDRWTMVME